METIKQRIFCYKSRKDWEMNVDSFLTFTCVCVNYNQDYAVTFCGDYARGIMEGMRVRYAAPFVAVYEMKENGERGALLATWGGQNLRR